MKEKMDFLRKILRGLVLLTLELIFEFVLAVGVYYTLTFLNSRWGWLTPQQVNLAVLAIAIVFANCCSFSSLLKKWLS